jgi:hypothetical protein
LNFNKIILQLLSSDGAYEKSWEERLREIRREASRFS